MVVRNPSDRAQVWTPDFRALLEVPAAAPTPRPTRIVHASSGRTLQALQAAHWRLEPFECVVLELAP